MTIFLGGDTQIGKHTLNSSHSLSSRLLHGSFTSTQLEQLGLFIKDDDDDDEEGLDFDGEEGEIFS